MIRKYLPPKKPIIIFLVVLLVLLAITVPSYYFYNKYQKSQELLKNPTESAKQEIKTLVEQVGKLIELPSEEPTLATVSDKSKLSDQAFFQKAENGDKVLIYSQMRKAILYRPSTNKIIEVSMINLNDGATETAASSASAQVANVKLAVYNGTNVSGLASKIEKELKAKLPNIDVTKRENAKKMDYEKTMVIVFTQGRENDAKNIADLLGAQVSSLPQGEVKPDADILIIIGSDFSQK